VTLVLGRAIPRYVRLAAAAAALAWVGGCMSQTAPSNAGMGEIRASMEEMAAIAAGKALREEVKSRRKEAERVDKSKADRLKAARLHFCAGYLYERLRKPGLAVEQYEAAAKAGGGTAYESNGHFRVGPNYSRSYANNSD